MSFEGGGVCAYMALSCPTASAELIEAVSATLPLTDTWCILYPALRKFLRCDIEEMNQTSILNNLELPVGSVLNLSPKTCYDGSRE